MQGGSDTEQDLVVRETETLGGHGRLHKSVIRGELAHRLASHAVHVILKIRVAETSDDLLDVLEVSLMIETELLHESLAALLHGGMNGLINLRDSDAVCDCRAALHLAEVCGDGMTGVQSEKFPLDVGQKVIGHIHSLNLWSRTDESLLFHIPFVESLHGDIDRILAPHRRDDAVNRAVRETDVLHAPSLLGLVQMGIYSLLET